MIKAISYSNSNSVFLKLIAKASLFFLLFYEFFGNSIFFVKKAENLDDLVSSNIVNQIIHIILFLFSSIILVRKFRNFIDFIRIEKYLSLFLVWCLLSVLWSDFSLVSFKRCIQLIISFNVISAAFLCIDSEEDILRYLQFLLALFVITSLLCILFIPSATHEWGAWRGIRTHKNQLGIISLFSAILWFYTFKQKFNLNRYFSFILFALSVILLFGSQSMNSIICFTLLWLAILIHSMNNHFRRYTTSYPFFPITIITFFIAIFIISYFYQDYLEILLHYIGKDITFTGRTNLWSEIIQYSKEHIIQGAGYGGFWVLENPYLIDIYKKFTWLPTQSHCGYLDLFNETGIIGLVLLLFVLKKLFSSLKNCHHNIWLWFSIVILVSNFMESTLFKQRTISGSIFILSYLILQLKPTNFRNSY